MTVLKNEKSSCVMPYIGLALQNHGDFCVCNINNMSFENLQREPMRVDTTLLKDAWRSHTRKLVATALDHGKNLPACSTCFGLEQAGKPSGRTQFNLMFEHVEASTSQPRVFILKPGNVCNLACRMCNPATSSGWYKDGHRLALENGFKGTQAEFSSEFEHIKNSFGKQNTQFWDAFVEWLPGLEFLDIYGGEPFLTPALFDAIERASKQTPLSNTSVALHTNAGFLNFKYIELLSRFKSCSLNLSVDTDVHDQLAYIRHLCDPELIFDNIEKFKDACKNYPTIGLSITITVTPLNVLDIDAVYTRLKKLLPAKLNFVTTPAEYDIRHMPLPVRKVIADRNPSLEKYILQTIPGCDVEWPKFVQHTRDLDRLRSQDFAKTFPELYQLVKPYM